MSHLADYSSVVPDRTLFVKIHHVTFEVCSHGLAELTQHILPQTHFIEAVLCLV